MSRAIDFGKKIYANLIALHKIQKIVAKELNIETGNLIMHNISAHIYEENFNEVEKLI